MRVFIAISIVVASVSSASAQSAIDPSRVPDAVQRARAIADLRAAAIAAGAPLLPRLKTNFYVGGGGTMQIVPRTAEDLKDDAAAQTAWTERCRPTVVEDREGLRRVKYAERDCDLSRFNTAGN